MVQPAGGVDRAVFDGGDDLHPVGAGGVARRAQVQLAGVEARVVEAQRRLGVPDEDERAPEPDEAERRLHRIRAAAGVEDDGRQVTAASVAQDLREVLVDHERVQAGRRGEGHPLGRDVGHQQPFDTGLRRQRHGQAHRSGAEHQHAVARFRLAPRHGVPTDAEGLDEHELVDGQPPPREQLGGGQHHALPQPARGRHTQYLDAFTAVATAASTRRAGAARQVRQDGAQLTR